MVNDALVSKLKQFMDNEAMSCSMDYGCMTPLYVYRMWGGSVAIDEIETGLETEGQVPVSRRIGAGY